MGQRRCRPPPWFEEVTALFSPTGTGTWYMAQAWTRTENPINNSEAIITQIFHRHAAQSVAIADIIRTRAFEEGHDDNNLGVWLYRPTIASVPEPSIGLLLGISLIGLVGVGAVRKIKKRKVANS